MSGGVLQLAAYGSQNFLLNNNPQISFFKSVYKAHSNFAMESKSVYFDRNDALVNDTTVFHCKLPRHGDLLSNMYLIIKLPAISLPTSGHRFKWCKHIGEALLESCYITNSGSKLDEQYGEWMYIWRQLTNDVSKIHVYNQLIGNCPDIYAPDYTQTSIGSPFIKEKTLCIPLGFWFTNPGLALPLVALQYHEIHLYIELRKLTQCYLIDMLDGNDYVAPQYGNPDHLLTNFIDSSLVTNNTLNVRPYLECNYIFLDTVERNIFMRGSFDYLIDQHKCIKKMALSGTATIDLLLQNPVREIIFLLRDVNSNGKNDWMNYTNATTGGNMLETAKLVYNGQDRFDAKGVEFFTLIQPYQHFHGSPPPGVCVYSFSLRPYEYQPSGACNMSMVNKVQLFLTLCKNVTCDCTIYATNYNFFRVIGGMAGTAFA